jgi:uncharacterized protein
VFEWDKEKNKANYEKHGLDFHDAQAVFSGVCRTIIDDRCDYGEERYVTFGALQGRTVIIAHTKRGDKTRIISMRKANSREQRYYLQQLISH